MAQATCPLCDTLNATVSNDTHVQLSFHINCSTCGPYRITGDVWQFLCTPNQPFDLTDKVEFKKQLMQFVQNNKGLNIGIDYHTLPIPLAP